MSPAPNSPKYTPIASESHVARVQRLRRFGRLMDSAVGIPGTKFRVGLDPIIGLIPGGGDTAGLVLSSYIVLEAARMGASKSVLSTMAFNILLETLAGTIPVVGDIFDVTWKSNIRNIQLLEEHLRIQRPPAENRWFAILLIAGLALALVGCVVLSIYVLRWLFQLVQSSGAVAS
ncbi:DUF4112 domain-containing protein [Phormidium tenue FACHB-886]|nr:DUF4112 domain-containing protein [Phormidium tenue FACHB-886]